MRLHGSGSRARTRGAPGIVDVAGKEVQQLGQDKRPGAHVGRLLLTPDDLLGVGECLGEASHLFLVERIELLDPKDRRGIDQVVLFAILDEVVIDLSGAEDDALRLLGRRFRSRRESRRIGIL